MLWIAMLRGINVGGHTVKMERLRQLFAELGFEDVRTYIQSGNVFFESPEGDRAALAQRIEQHLRRALGYDVPVCLRTVAELEAILALDPFEDRDVTPNMRLCITFTAKPIPSDLVVPWRSPNGDVEIVRTTSFEAFVIWYIINGRPPSTLAPLERALGGKTTTRFFHTTAQILAAAKQGQEEMAAEQGGASSALGGETRTIPRAKDRG